MLEDFVTEIDLVTGEVRGRLSLLRPLLESAWQEVVPRPPTQRDVLQNNTINVLGEVAVSPFESGHLLLSMREVDTVGVFDLETGSWVWAQRGPWRRQHEPVYRPGGRILLFDNQGGAGRMARALLWDVADGRVEREVGGFVSLEAGAVAALPNGNWLVTVSESGYAVELDPRGDRVWEFRSPHRAGRDGELVATLFEVVRLSPSLLAELR